MTSVSMIPLLSVRGGGPAVEFYKSAFGAVEKLRLEDPSGAVFAQLAVEGAEFWVSDESPEHQNFSPASLGGSTARIILSVADPDAVFARAVAAGATSISPVAESHGWRSGRIQDPFGHHWEIACPTEGK
jgi:PhnB protein